MSSKFEIAQEFARTINSDKIKRIMLFGSVARGDYRPDSDIDILIVSNYRKDIWSKIKVLIGDTILEKGELLSVHVMPEEFFNQTKVYSFLTNVRKEGIVLEEVGE